MNQPHTFMRHRCMLLLWLLVAATAICAGCGPRHLTRGVPLDVDFDMEDIPEPSEERTSPNYDFVDRTFFKELHQLFDAPRQFRKLAGRPRQSVNVDAFGNVPNSSWFTNRNERRPMSLSEIKLGSVRGAGPAPGLWRVVRGKSQGVTAGFRVRDTRGDLYVFKFDPPDNPELATAAELISSRLFYAMGYNTPQYTLVHFARQRLVVDPDARLVDRFGEKRPMTAEDLDDLLSRVARRDDGTYRAVASKFLDGVPKGPFSYHGVREDDPNDIIRHEHRRDLRALRILAGWLLHNDIRRINSLDAYVEENGRHFLRHYLIDFGATLGSASLFPNQPWEGHEYIFDVGETAKSFFTLGLYKRPWFDAGRSRYPSVGYFESTLFDPARWKPNYPNPAFENATSLDIYWATKIVMSFTDAQIRAAVEAGELSDPNAEDYLVRTLIERRDKIGRYGFSIVSPLDHFAVSGTSDGSTVLRFDDLAVRAGFADPVATSYRFNLAHRGGHEQGRVTDDRTLDGAEALRTGIPLGDLVESARAHLAALAPGTVDCGRFFDLALRTRRGDGVAGWGKAVTIHLYLLDGGPGFEIVSVEREG